MSLSGITIFAIIFGAGVILGEFTKVFLNIHAFLIVIGGTLAATLINTPFKYIKKSLDGLKLIFWGSDSESADKTILYMVELAENVKRNGFKVFKDVDENMAGGFLKQVCEAAIEYSDSQFVKKVIEDEINYSFDEANEISNVFRTMSLLSPMFGLVGTLIGIIAVLKELSNPESVGPAMAVAITSAFYGIIFSNLVFIPIAGKIRIKSIMRVKMKIMILEGVLEMMKGSIPIMVERRLKAFNK
ncbi:MAG: MotA/TolQ/ExbB proton channel family protein [Elusimicrobia bacterium]|nr:MotA/TolQ/ExbB proton channel family protein [Elusimicrobiota bacterium]